jgi:hypothetical protein
VNPERLLYFNREHMLRLMEHGQGRDRLRMELEGNLRKRFPLTNFDEAYLDSVIQTVAVSILDLTLHILHELHT